MPETALLTQAIEKLNAEIGTLRTWKHDMSGAINAMGLAQQEMMLSQKGVSSNLSQLLSTVNGDPSDGEKPGMAHRVRTMEKSVEKMLVTLEDPKSGLIHRIAALEEPQRARTRLMWIVLTASIVAIIGAGVGTFVVLLRMPH